MKNTNPATRTVEAIGRINFTGNIIPQQWFNLLKYESGKPNINAIIILSELVYWYRPVEIRDEHTGQIIGQKKKFKKDILQRSYQSLADCFGLTKRQVTDACHFLQGKGLIKLIFQTVQTEATTLGNVLFIDINPQAIEEITFPSKPEDSDPITSKRDRSHVSPSEVSHLNVRDVTPERETYTEITTEITTETSTFNPEREGENLTLVNCPVVDRDPPSKPVPLSTPPRLQIGQDDDLESIVFELQGRGYEPSKILYELKIRNKVPPYRTRFGSSSAIDKDFLQFIQLKHLQPLDCNKNRTVTIEDARSWITKRERDLAFEDILSKYRTFTETYLPEVVGRQLNQELERLHRSIELPEEWAHRFKTWYLVDLTLEQKQKYLTWLKEQPSENYAAA